ncbi:GATA transcription factor 26-like [Aristolochia californica]|uniref:GATA transcription factor 26-like n=1 Tax=Aristolochia californica TaxID=171875 RepID=UPI0035DC903F
MGKQGPCYHCGVASTPLWRNGPPEKPVLCNACGSRWRTKGTLTNYTPLHARADLIESEDFKGSKMKSISIKIKEQKLQKRKYSDVNSEVEGVTPLSDQSFRKVVEEDMSNRSSSGSAISYSESCVHFGGTDGGEWTGSAQSTVWDTIVPSKRRTCISRAKPSSVEKLTKDLYSILHEQQQQSSYLSGSSEVDLLFESGTPMDSFGIGHGGVLIKHLTSEVRDEESEASSLPVDNKTQITNKAYSGSRSLPVGTKGMGFSGVGNETFKKPVEEEMLVNAKRDKVLQDSHHVLRSSSSPLGFIDLREVVSFEEFMKHLNPDEQQQLMKFLPSVDVAIVPDSLKTMFESPQFSETLSCFQHLLLEGIFELSISEINSEECRTLKRLALANLAKSKWVERYQHVKDAKQKKVTGGKAKAAGTTFTSTGKLAPAMRPNDGQNLNLPEPKYSLKGPKRGHRSVHIPYTKSPQTNSHDGSCKINDDTKDTDNEGSCFSPRSLFAFPPDRSSCMLDSWQFTDESSEQDLLFDVPSNAYFPQAELLDRNIWKANSSENRVTGQAEALSHHPPMTFVSQKLKESSLAYPHLVLQ